MMNTNELTATAGNRNMPRFGKEESNFKNLYKNEGGTFFI